MCKIWNNNKMYLATKSRSSIAFYSELMHLRMSTRIFSLLELAERRLLLRDRKNSLVLISPGLFLPLAPGYVLTTWLALVAYVTFLVKHASEHEIHISNKFDKKNNFKINLIVLWFLFTRQTTSNRRQARKGGYITQMAKLKTYLSIS